MSSLRDIRARKSKPTGSWLEGRGLAVAVVVMIAGSCFALGFFVGSASTEREVVTEIIRVPEPPPRLVVEGDDVLPIQPGAPTLSIEGPLGDPDGRDESRQYTSAALPDAPANSYAPPPASYDDGPALSPRSAQRPAPAARPSAPPKQTAPAAAPAPAPQSASSRARYAVQLGAFGELGDAARLKKTFAAKGYDAYIYRETMASGASIFKVRLGSYADVEEARRMALKIKSAEGVAAFVAEIK